MENPVNQFGYLSSVVMVRGTGISPVFLCLAVPYTVGSTAGQTYELLGVLHSYHNAQGSCEPLNVPQTLVCCLVKNSNWESLLLAH